MKPQLQFDKAYVASGIKFGQYHTLVLEVVNKAPVPSTMSEGQSLFLIQHFQKQLEERIRQTGVFREVKTQKEGQPLTLRVFVTALDPGNQTMRTLVGFGAGAARFEAEGEAVDESTGSSLFRFVDARAGDSLNDFASNEDLLKDDVGAMASNIATVFAAHP